jgi:hypothetical protein
LLKIVVSYFGFPVVLLEIQFGGEFFNIFGANKSEYVEN